MIPEMLCFHSSNSHAMTGNDSSPEAWDTESKISAEENENFTFSLSIKTRRRLKERSRASVAGPEKLIEA